MSTNFFDIGKPGDVAQSSGGEGHAARQDAKTFVSGGEFKSMMETQYESLLKPNMLGAVMSYEMSTSGYTDFWTVGRVTYDNGGYHKDGSHAFIIPKDLGGLYLVLVDVIIGGTDITSVALKLGRSLVSTLTAVDSTISTVESEITILNVADPVSYTATVESEITIFNVADPVSYTATVESEVTILNVAGAARYRMTTIRVIHCSPGEEVSITGGATGSWTTDTDSNQLIIIKFPFGS